MKKLGVNIDHVATLRQARGGLEPDPCHAALQAEKAGAHQITVHLREDRRHIQDSDVLRIQSNIKISLNLEMSINPEIVKFALRARPDKVCIVPEKRREVTTEGGLDVCDNEKALKNITAKMKKKKIQVSLFINPAPEQIRAARRVGTHAIEIHTGRYANAGGKRRLRELDRIRKAAKLASELGLIVHAGHGLNYANVGAIAKIPEIEELNIGHSIVSRAIFVGMQAAIHQMLKAIRSGTKKR